MPTIPSTGLPLFWGLPPLRSPPGTKRGQVRWTNYHPPSSCCCFYSLTSSASQRGTEPLWTLGPPPSSSHPSMPYSLHILNLQSHLHQIRLGNQDRRSRNLQRGSEHLIEGVVVYASDGLNDAPLGDWYETIWGNKLVRLLGSIWLSWSYLTLYESSSTFCESGGKSVYSETPNEQG